MTRADVRAMSRFIEGGGLALFPADTVYGLACDPDQPAAVERLYRLKGRAEGKPAAVMFSGVQPARALAPGPRTRAALEVLLPGAVTVLLPNPHHRFPLAGGDPDTLGVRVPRFTGPLAPMSELGGPVLQSSANLSGGADPSRLEEVDARIRAGVDVILDGGPLPGTPSTVLDLREFEESGGWTIVREGAEPRERVERALSSLAL